MAITTTGWMAQRWWFRKRQKMDHGGTVQKVMAYSTSIVANGTAIRETVAIQEGHEGTHQIVAIASTDGEEMAFNEEDWRTHQIQAQMAYATSFMAI
jgi:hypothetical protein